MGLVTNLSFAIAGSGLMFLATVPANAASVTLSYDSSIGRPANFAAGENHLLQVRLRFPKALQYRKKQGTSSWLMT